MGKRQRLNKLISKWIKSDLPDDRSSALFLSVGRARQSPKSPRRPFSLPLAFGVVSSCSKAQVRRNSSSVSNGRRGSVGRRDSRRGLDAKGERPPKGDVENIDNVSSSADKCINQNGHAPSPENPHSEISTSCDINPRHLTEISNLRLEINPAQDGPKCVREVAKGSDQVPPAQKLTNSDRKSAFLNSDLPQIVLTSPENLRQFLSLSNSKRASRCSGLKGHGAEGCSMVKMETSVDSIGACSLDMEASRELPSDWSEVGSADTLLGSKVSESRQQHLPSYLSLACTVNGYSTTTNYDRERLTKSRDASPHRIDQNSHLTADTYSVTNNLLSPPNLVPLPAMSEDALRARQPKLYYSYTKTVTILNNESHRHYSGTLENSKDTTDTCLNQEVFSYNRTLNGSLESTTISKEYANGKETKSFIQQRVERLYGPGALAQGFFVSKRQQNRLSETEDSGSKLNKKIQQDKHSDEENIEPLSIKQSSSSPSLPVLRHLRPEFRAQLPLASPKKVAEGQVSKRVTVPKLKEESKVNGHVKSEEESVCSELPVIKQNGSVNQVLKEQEPMEKDGHYFLKVLEKQASRLLTLADKADSEISTPHLSEEVIGKIRSASGKARLLVSQKMQQFKGLCTNNINQSVGEVFPTTNQDLQGFWDMVMLQVDQVDNLFKEINRLRENNWKEETPKTVEIMSNGTSKPRKTVSKPKLSAAAEEARKQREEQRKKMIEERRKAMKATQQLTTPSIKIFVPESS
ncbi:uncharacterized protein [Euwallacea fornicatus]|uniref:uncharacterized protein isoform X1 n=2 Tax=Euwallacea fornicatus TaxID=995702 RepID=UPI00338EDF5A